MDILVGLGFRKNNNLTHTVVVWGRNCTVTEVFIGSVVVPIICLSKIIFQELYQLEEDVKLLEEMYPQGEKVVIQIAYFLTSWHNQCVMFSLLTDPA